MSIDINKVVKFNQIKKECEDFGGVEKESTYFQVSKLRGVKITGCDWGFGNYETLADLKNSYDWEIATKEYRMGMKAWKAGLGPQPIALNTMLNTHFSPCIRMEHLDGKVLADSALSIMDILKVQFALHARLQQARIYHNDFHYENIIVGLKKDAKPNNNGFHTLDDIKWVRAIDFESCVTIQRPTILEAKKNALYHLFKEICVQDGDKMIYEDFESEVDELYWSDFGDRIDWYGPVRTNPQKNPATTRNSKKTT